MLCLKNALNAAVCSINPERYVWLLLDAVFDVFRLCLGCVRPSVFGLCLSSFKLNAVFRCLGDTKHHTLWGWNLFSASYSSNMVATWQRAHQNSIAPLLCVVFRCTLQGHEVVQIGSGNLLVNANCDLKICDLADFLGPAAIGTSLLECSQVLFFLCWLSVLRLWHWCYFCRGPPDALRPKSNNACSRSPTDDSCPKARVLKSGCRWRMVGNDHVLCQQLKIAMSHDILWHSVVLAYHQRLVLPAGGPGFEPPRDSCWELVILKAFWVNFRRVYMCLVLLFFRNSSWIALCGLFAILSVF